MSVTDDLGNLDLTFVLLGAFVQPCSIPFRCEPQPIVDCDRRPFVIEVREGIPYIESDESPSEEPPEHELEKTYQVPGSSDIPEDLQTLTSELRRFTEDICDIRLINFTLTWGLRTGEYPCLVDCLGTHYSTTPTSAAFKNILLEVCLFLAIETSQISVSGTCFSRRTSCCGSEMNIPRQKVELYRIRKFVDAIESPEPQQLNAYLRRRLSKICPSIMLSSVPVCRNCFALYSREKMPMPGSDQLVLPTRSSYTATGERPRQPQPTPVAQKLDPIFGKKSPSGLTYVQTWSLKSYKRSRPTYMEAPFPAFLQRHDPK
jgi:hypothetical protein